jgi:FMN reductase
MLIVGIGGTTRPSSSSECALRTALAPAERAGAEVRCFTAQDLDLPMYDPSSADRTPKAQALVDAIRECDGLVLSSPGYHGTVSGLVKNALDYVEDLRDTTPSYFDGRAVGCVAVGYGWQGAVATMRDLRGIVHALRGWPTPYGAAVNAALGGFEDGVCTDPELRAGLELVGEQVLEFARAVRGVTV